jgi:hypothetical protein
MCDAHLRPKRSCKVTYSKQGPPGIEETKQMLGNTGNGNISIPPPPAPVKRTEAEITSARACFNECRKLLGKPEKIHDQG